MPRNGATSTANLRIWSMTQGIGSHQIVSSCHTCTTSKPMSYFLCKSIQFGSFNVRNLLPPISGKTPNVYSLRFVSSSSNQQSFVVSYLVKSLGLSAQCALSVSKHVNFKTPEKPDKLINLLKKYGFTQDQISGIVKGNPKILSLDAEKIILPKLEFFEAKGISAPEMGKMLSAFPRVMTASLAKRIMPSFDFYRILLQSDEKTIVTIKKFPNILAHSIKKTVSPNIDILRGHGVPDYNIAKLVYYYPRVFMLNLDLFRETLDKVVDMGFDVSKVNFVLAVNTFLSISKSTWESKVDMYKKCGWSEDEVLKAFKRNPWCMMFSEDKIMAGMDFFTNKMGSRPCLIANHPKLLSLSLKKRLIPRSLVFQVLLSKGLVKEKVSLAALFDSPEKKFLQKFVVPYEKKAPEVLKLYKEKLNLSSGLLVDKV